MPFSISTRQAANGVCCRPIFLLANCVRSFSTPAAAGRLGGDASLPEPAGASKKGRQPTPSYLIIDSQSVKTQSEGEARGFHGGKKIKGRSRQVAVDTQGLIWAVHVHAANGADSIEGCVLADLAMAQVPTVQAWCADAGYRGSFEHYMEEAWEVPVHISERIAPGFAVIAKRWVVERTFSWGNGQRRLSQGLRKIDTDLRSDDSYRSNRTQPPKPLILTKQLLSVVRTLADLDGIERISGNNVWGAINFPTLDRALRS